MSNFSALCISDIHLKDFSFRNQHLDLFEYNASLEMFKKVYAIIEEHNIEKLYIIGDLLDAVGLAQSLDLMHQFFTGLPKGLNIKLINGNHELIEGKAKKQYYFNTIKQKMLDNYGVEVLEYNEINKTLFCGHMSISKLENLSKHYDIVYSHFRSNLMPLASDEINVEMLEHKAGLVVLGDLHFQCSYSNIVYCGSPIDTSFSSSNELPDHQPSVLILNEDTLEWKWKDTLTTSYRKYKRVYPSVKKFLEDIENLEQDATDNSNFYKIVIQDKKANLKQVNVNNYKHFAIFELNHIDLMFDKENKKIDKQIIDNLSAKNVSNNLLDFIIKNCDRKELIENTKQTYFTYNVGSAKEAND